jgi:hypothetical protein
MSGAPNSFTIPFALWNDDRDTLFSAELESSLAGILSESF